MATFTLLVTHPPFDHQAAYSAYRFALAACQAGHLVNGVFFYQAGALNGNAFQAGLSDDLHLYRKWDELAVAFKVPLAVCVTAANRRGVINADDAAEQDASFYNLKAPFVEVGLGEFVELSQQADRVIQF